METYSYKALTAEGVEIKGVVQAPDEFTAVRQIREKCPVITSITPVRGDFLSRLLKTEIGNTRIKIRSLALMCSQFAITLKSGLPIGRAMEMIANQTEDKKLKKILTDSAEVVLGGTTVANAFERYKTVFPVTFIETIRAGEMSGNLDQSFENLQHYFENNAKIQEKVKSALSYPIFVAIVAVIVLIVIMAKVVPALTQTFASLGGTLPLPTRMLIAISGFFADWWILFLILILALIIGWKLMGRWEKGRTVLARMQLEMPVIGKIAIANGSAQFANTMSVMLASGLNLDRATEVTSNVMDNYLLQLDVNGMIRKIEEGKSLGNCIQTCEYFPATLKEMSSVGEETGELDKTLSVIGDYFSNEAERRTKNAISMLEPTLLIFMALVAGFIVISIYLPMFTMYDLM